MYKVVPPPSYVCWFINHSKCRYNLHSSTLVSYETYQPTERYLWGTTLYDFTKNTHGDSGNIEMDLSTIPKKTGQWVIATYCSHRLFWQLVRRHWSVHQLACEASMAHLCIGTFRQQNKVVPPSHVCLWTIATPHAVAAFPLPRPASLFECPLVFSLKASQSIKYLVVHPT